MPRKRKKQSFSFPQADQPTPEELDSLIDGDSPVAAEPPLEKIRRDSKAKKDAALVVKEIPQIFTPEQVVWVFDVYCGLICFVYSILLKTKFEIVWDELKLDDDVKQLWAKPLAKIASKYAPAEWAGMTAEIELVASLGMWTVVGFGRAKMAVKKEEEKKAEAAKQRPGQARPQPISATV